MNTRRRRRGETILCTSRKVTVYQEYKLSKKEVRTHEGVRDRKLALGLKRCLPYLGTKNERSKLG